MDAYRLGYKTAAQSTRFGKKVPADFFPSRPLLRRIQYSKDTELSEQLGAHIYRENLLGRLASYLPFNNRHIASFVYDPKRYYIQYRPHELEDKAIKDTILTHELEHKKQWEDPNWRKLSDRRSELLATLAELKHMLKNYPKHPYLKELPERFQFFMADTESERQREREELQEVLTPKVDPKILKKWSPVLTEN